ncbi:hypothetical protein BGY98DRAFT_1093579 [Russula aff. rugulosa BPL654]|nr:hypothetical protein BGY98DRAFT_1093579 [Russula aff. rugulosa BPL654]
MPQRLSPQYVLVYALFTYVGTAAIVTKVFRHNAYGRFAHINGAYVYRESEDAILLMALLDA